MSGKRSINRFLKKLSRFKRVALDTSCFIYQLSNHPRFADFTSEVFERIEKGEIQGVTSTISVVEFFVKPEKDNDLELIQNYETILLNFPNLEIVPLDFTIARLAASIRAKYSFRTPDALQLALAQMSRSGAFITNDKKLKKFKEVEVITLSDYCS